MLIYLFIGCVLVAWCVDWTASRKHFGATVVVIILGAVATLAMQRATLAHFGYRLPEWAFSLALVWDGIFLSWIAYHVWLHCEPVTIRGVIAYFRRMFADSRRRSSVRTDVRRAVKMYTVEVG